MADESPIKVVAAVVLALAAGGLVVKKVQQRSASSGGLPTAKLDHPWPPVKGQPYPDLQLRASTGELVELSSLRGKVVIVEPIGMSCPACNAYAGGDERGGFRGAGVQPQVGSAHELLGRFARLNLDTTQDVVLVQLLLFDMTAAAAPTAEDCRAWAEHFRLGDRKNILVLQGTPALANQASYAMVPGFQVVDRKGVLRYDGSGHHPIDRPYDVALAAIPDLLNE